MLNMDLQKLLLPIQTAISSTFNATTTSTATTAKKAKKKRPLAKVIADIPDPKTVIFDPLCVPSKHPPILHLPPGLDTDDPYSLFTLFWPERMWTTITTNTNIYAVKKRFQSKHERMRPWSETCPAERSLSQPY
jgi:hypothetical protein